MTVRFRNLLVIAVFAALHLVAQPFAATLRCDSGASAGGACGIDMSGSCCCGSAADASCAGCCPADPFEGGDDEGSNGSAGTAYVDLGCLCGVTSPAPALPPSTAPSWTSISMMTLVVERSASPQHDDVWPGPAQRPSMPRARPPRAKPKTQAVFTQVFRL